MVACTSGRLVHYTIPESYRGPFWVIHDPAAPALPKDANGWHQVTVPATGVILASSLTPLDEWHESTAVLGSSRTGADLEVGKTIVTPGMVGIWLGPSGRIGPGGREYRSFFVGTQEEFMMCPPERFNPRVGPTQ